jgi:two-component system, LytTR family, response regulator
MLTAIIIDDERRSRNALRQKLTQYCADVQIIGECESGEDGIRCIEEKKPAIVFLDVEMPRMNGFTMLQQLSNRNFDLIFVTAFDHYAIQAIKYSALDYLVKPIEVPELQKAIERVNQKHQHSNPDKRLEVLLDNLGQKKHERFRIGVPTATGLAFLRVEHIIYLEAQDNYTHIFLDDKRKYIVSRTMKDFEEMLPAETFLRIHNSHIINKNFAEKYIRGDGGQVVLTNGAVLDIAKRKKAEFLKAIGYI